MAEENLTKQETTSAEPSARGSAEDEWVPTKDAIKIAGTSARTLKRRADLGTLRRTSVHTSFGIENRYYIKELEKIKQELSQKAAEVVAEVSAELKGRRAEGADLLSAGGDTKQRSVAELAEVSKVMDQKIAKITEPFFKLASTLETGFEKLLHFQEQTAKSQALMIEIEDNRDREREKQKESANKRIKSELLRDRVTTICYIVATLAILGAFGCLVWMMYGISGWGRW